MWIILGMFFSYSAFALEPFEKLGGVKILRALPGNIVLLNRGLEDGLQRNDHIKISSETQGFSSRGICLKTSNESSYWKLYRVPYSEAFSQDMTYTISGLADREIPLPQANLRDIEHDIPGPKKKVAAGPDPFAVKRDLPEKLTERDLLEATGPERRQLFIEQTLNRDQLRRDLEDYRISLYASPFVRQSINQGESLRYGFRGGNIASKYRLLTQFEQQQSKLRDPVTKDTVSTRSTSGQVQFVVHRLSPSLSSLTLANYNSYRFSKFATPKSHWQFGPIGFTWHLFENRTWEYFDLSYVPLYDIRETEVPRLNRDPDIDRQTGFRHGFRLATKTRINERVAFENLLWVRPHQNLATWEVDTRDLNLVNDLKLIFNLTEKLFFDYNLVYQKDKLWKTLSGLPESNVINSLNVRYDIDL